MFVLWREAGRGRRGNVEMASLVTLDVFLLLGENNHAACGVTDDDPRKNMSTVKKSYSYTYSSTITCITYPVLLLLYAV